MKNIKSKQEDELQFHKSKVEILEILLHEHLQNDTLQKFCNILILTSCYFYYSFSKRVIVTWSKFFL